MTEVIIVGHTKIASIFKMGETPSSREFLENAVGMS
jgi:hypothetical protein